MKSLFQRHPRQQPILAPRAATAAWRRHLSSYVATLPPAAIPIAATVGGGIVVLVVAAMFAGSGEVGDRMPGERTAAVEPAADTVPGAAQPADAAVPPVSESASVAPGPAVPRPSGAPAPRADGPEAIGARPDPERQPAPDQQRTAAIPPAMPGASQMRGPVVPVAETEDEVLALEAIQRTQVEEDVGQPSDDRTAAIPDEPEPSMQPATTTQYVNLRAAPDDDGEVLEVVPALASIEAEGGCNWCAVTYEGRQGYIYKSFISYE